MRIKAIYRKKLKMSAGKLAAQVAHAVRGLDTSTMPCDIIVLGVSDRKFNIMVYEADVAVQAGVVPRYYVQRDKGLTEVAAGTETAAAWIEEK